MKEHDLKKLLKDSKAESLEKWKGSFRVWKNIEEKKNRFWIYSWPKYTKRIIAITMICFLFVFINGDKQEQLISEKSQVEMVSADVTASNENLEEEKGEWEQLYSDEELVASADELGNYFDYYENI